MLLQHAAAGGEPAAQGEVGWRAALGLRPSQAHVFEFTEPDIPKWVLLNPNHALCSRNPTFPVAQRPYCVMHVQESSPDALLRK